MRSSALGALLQALLVGLLWASSPERAPPGTSSLTFVFDTTGSMNDDLIQVQDGARKILDTVLTQREKLIYNYVYVPFHDPRVGPVFATTDSNAFQRHLNSVHVVGGGDCPEMTLSGIQLALETALPSSFIYVFTDARSKDYHLEDQILNLIQEKQSSVVFVMTGDCNDRTHPGFRTYEKIAAASFGQVFHLEKTDVNKVLNYVRHSVAVKKVHVLYEVRERGGTNLRQIPVDHHLNELTLSLSGDKDDGDFLDISLVDPKGSKVERIHFTNESGTIDLNNIKLIRIKDPMPGIWRVRTSSRLKHTLRVLGHGAIDFKYGFSARPVDKIELSHQRPVSHQSSYLLVNMTGLTPPGTAVEISLVDYYGKELLSKPASINKQNPYLYYMGPFVPPKGLFFVRVKGEDDKSFEFQRIAPTAISSVQAGGPRAYMADRTTAFATQSVNLTCSIASRSEFTLYWFKGREKLGGPLFYPYSDTSVWTLSEVTPQDRGEYRCVVVSENGNHTASTFLETREPAPEITSVRNESVAVGMSAFLHCRTQSQHPTIQWTRGGNVIGNSDRTRLYPNGTLMIISTSRQDAGGYRCRVQTGGGTAEATIFLKILEMPKASIYPTSLFFVRGQSFNFSCYATGDPKPEPQWYFKGNLIKPDHHKYYITYKYDLIVHRPSESDAGVYECRASNQAGYHVDSAVAQMAIAPKVKVTRDRQMIGRGDRVVLECQVLMGNPKPKVIWYRGGREVPSYRYIQIEGGRLTIQGVQDSDAGSYTCVAQNIAGRDFGNINLDVGSMPTIVPTPETVRVNIERSITLQCRAIGHPIPKISWHRHSIPIEKMAPRVKILPDGSLLISNSQMEDQDRYTCTAKNIFGQQDKTTMLMVTGLVSPVLGHVPPEEQLVEGKDLRLSCVVVLGTPKPTLKWFKDGRPLQPSETVIVEGGGSGLLLRRGNPKDEGRYTCAAISPAGNATLNINVQLIRKPVIESSGVQDYVVSLGESVDLPCKVKGKPQPKITWSLDGKPLTASGHEYIILADNTLRIHRANNNHIGKYVCTASNPAGETELAASLNVLSAPVIAPGQISYNLIQGNPITLPCEVKGEPVPKITWYLNDEVFTDGILNKDGSLTIPSADELHRGHFKCVAENEVGIDERIVVLTVHTAPTIEGSGQVKTVVVNVNESVILPCPARAQPPPTRTWSYEGDRLYPGYTHGSEIRFAVDGSIELATPQMNHAGKYTCHVSNLAGDDHITYLLKVQEPPLIISDIPGTIDVVLGMILEIPCRAIGTPDPTVTWEKDGFQIIPDDVVQIDPTGTLRIERTQLSHRGDYRCLASNPAGKDLRNTLVVVQEPPIILPTTLSDYTTVEGDRIELRCFASANPPPVITWSRKGLAITDDTPGMHVTDDGTLVIESVENDDGGHYMCEASNAAGDVDKIIRLSVITPPDIPDQHTIITETVIAGQPFSLYCPVFSAPLPQITWHLDDRPIAEGDSNIHLSDDKRRLHILRSRTTDAGSYKCVARNPAGESSKTFQVEVLVPPNLDESSHKLKLSVLENAAAEIGCPVSGIPSPDISWLANGQLLEEGRAKRGIVLAPGGKSVLIDSAQLYHEGIYTCVAANKAGSLDIDVQLTVLAPPKLGDDEELEVVVGKGVTLNCDVEQEGLQSTITWLANGSASLPSNAQVVLRGRRLYVDETVLANHGDYQCRVRNNAGESKKNFKLSVIAPPQFRDKEYTDDIQLTAGTALTLTCYVDGSPQPAIKWLRDGRVVNEAAATLSDDDQKLIVQHSSNANHRYACLAGNKAGTISREFSVQVIAPPEIDESGDRTVLEVFEGQLVTLECPVSAPIGIVDIDWLKHGRPVAPDEVNTQISLDKTRLVLMNVRKEDEAVFTCVAKNSAGQAAREFELIVLVPPRIVGKMVEDVVVIEGESLELECDFEADPMPEIFWFKDGTTVGERIQLLNEKRTALVSSAGEEDAGSYRCAVRNKAGRAEKTFNVRVILKPELIGSNETTAVEMLITHPITFECPIVSPVGVELMWAKNEIPVVSGTENIQVLNGGRHLLISSVAPHDEAVYTCVARNQAGQARKNFKLSVLVPPSILGVGGEHKVVENNSLILPCEVEGYPMPRIDWTKDGRSALSLPLVQTLSEGQQFKIISANAQHRGSYMCTALNKVGKAEISFDVDVITRPTVAQRVKDTVEVIKNESAVFRCPITDKNFVGEITWLKDFEPINVHSHKYALSHASRKLHLLHSELRDEGSYSCRVKNDAGESRVDYKLLVLVPPEIIMLDKDKNRTAIENSTVLLSCPVTGKPEPTIEWYRDGELLKPENITRRIRSGRLEGNDLRIVRIQVGDTGRYTCEARNKAGLAEQDVLIYVMTPPRIEREGVPSEIGGKSRSTVTISCPAYGRPPPAVTWLKAGRPLEYSPEVYLSANGMKLHFIDLKKEHADRYTCIARNLAGEDKRDFSLKMLEAPTIEGPNILRKVQVNAGRASIINCPVMGSPEPSIAWLKNGQPLATDERHVLLNGGRQLQISDTTLHDDARYTCIATNNIGLADLETYLQVIGSPVIAGDKLETVEVLVNEPHDLECEVSGTEPMDIEWQRGGQTIDFGGIRGGSNYMQVSARGRRLHILSAQVADTGRFSCVSRNSAGEARKSYDLKVLVPPMINETTSSPPLQTIIPGTAFAVECKVDAIPEAEVVWKLNERRVVADDTVVLLNGNQTLWVNRASDQFGGRYTCDARNKVGHATRDFLVKLTAPPVLDRGSQELDVVVGDYIVLTCKVMSGTGTLSVKWLVDGKPVHNGPISPTVSVNDRRIEIRNARLSDSGNYVCIVENEAGQARKKFDLAVLERPRFLDMTNLSPSIIVGRPLVLDCSVTGTPKPTVMWLKNGKPINDSNVLLLNDHQQLHIESATEGDAGRYSCVAENKPGRVEKDLIVAVLKPPRMADHHRAFEVPENDTHTLVCPISDPSVGIQWLKNGVPITTSSNLQLSTSGHNLHIMRGQVSDGGRYSCRASNDAGEDTSNMDIIILVPPKIVGPPFRTIDAILNQTVQMECKTSGTPPPEIIWSFDGKTIFPSEKTQILKNGTLLRLLGVQGNQEGRYSCTSTNKVGRAEADTFLQVTAPPHIITPSDELKVIAGQGQTIRCEVSGTPPPKVEWLKNGKKFDAAMTQASSNLHYIHLREAQVEDAGRYTCIATNRAGEHRMSTELHVLVPPQILEGERVVQVKENTTLTLECQATGNPAPQIVWKRDGVPMESAQGPRLVINSPMGTDAGRFTCEARNEAGKASADFEVDVFIKPRFRDLKSDIRVRDGERTRLECKVDGHPTPTITWLRGGRPIEDMKNLILSPRGETLMILKAKRADAGSYSCVAKNFAGESEASFTVTVLTKPHIDEQIDQNPRVVQNNDILLHCPARGNPKPTVFWLLNGEYVQGDRYSIVGDGDLKISSAQEIDAGRYTCLAQNEAGSLGTDYELEVIGPPRFHHEGSTVYEVKVDESITMDCAVDAEPRPEIIWYRGDSPLYLTDNIHISPDGQQITLRGAQVTDGGKYTCRAKNEAGSADIDLTLKVLVPPSIDKSNIIGNPLAIVGRSIYLECPVTGIPQPTVTWYKEGNLIDARDDRIVLDQNNQTFGILYVEIADQGRYFCVAENKGGRAEQEFNLEVLVPPQMETTELQRFTRREDDSLTLWCPVKQSTDGTTVTEVFWYKDGRPIDSNSAHNLRVTSDGRRLQVMRTTLGDAGNYTCIALNRAGESSLDFDVEILSAPKIDGSRNDVHPHVTVGRPITIWCTVSGHPFPTVRWLKDGKIETGNTNNDIRILENGQALEIIDARPEHSGIWTCEAENDAGKAELEFNVDVWTPPTVTIDSDETIKAIDSPITLHCHARGNPQPSLSWSMGGQPLISSAEGARISLKGTRLDIPRLQQSHVGEYTCSARNEAGSAETSVHVDVLVPPVISRDNIEMSPRLPTGQTLTLLCDASGKPLPKLAWYINSTLVTQSSGSLILGEDGRYIQINNISLMDRGTYRCIASNVAGRDELLYTVAIVQAPTIANGGTQQVIEGEVAKINCNAYGEPTPVVTWQRNGVRVETGVRYIAEDTVLTVIETRSSDSGIYVCVATNEAGTTQQAFTLEVLVAPRIVATSPNESVVPVNNPFSLKCGVRGYPFPEIIWTIDDKPVEAELGGGFSIAEDGTLFIEKAKEKAVHRFKCIARNDAGTDEKEYIVNAISPPFVTKEGLKTINSTEGDPSLLVCEIEGHAPRIYWYKDGAPISSSPNVEISDGGTQLKIHSSKLHDEGLYTCVAMNTAGNATQKQQLYVGVPPRITEKPRRIIVKSGQPAELWCEAVGIPQPQIRWLKDDVALPQTAVDDRSETPKSTAIFPNVSSADAGVYTCKADNWAGTSYKDVDLVVLIPPAIYPEMINLTANLEETLILPCNASGIPEPVVSWVKMPNIDIIGNEDKYQILGTSLAIRNIGPEDDGFYHCIAKSNAGQAIGARRLSVIVPKKDYKVIWVECDDVGNPVKTTYVPARGDMPENEDNLLPWKQDYQDLPTNGTDGILIRCLPGVREPRRVPLEAAPHFAYTPRTQTVRKGSIIDLHCSAHGPPTPEIFWMKDGEMLAHERSVGGHSTLRIDANDKSVGGTYVCIAQNIVGTSRTQARIIVEEAGLQAPDHRTTTQHVAVLTCLEDGIPQSESVTWTIHGEPVDKEDNKLHIMNNQSLVIFDVNNVSPVDLHSYQCYVRNRAQSSDVEYMDVVDDVPKVVVHQNKIYTRPGDEVVIDCHLQGNPLTTKVQWTKNNVPLVIDERVTVLTNNSLRIKKLRLSDRASYKCRASNSHGKSWDGLDVIVQDGPGAVVGFIDGVVNNAPLTNQALYMNVTPEIDDNSVFIKIDNLVESYDPVASAMIGYMSAACQQLAYDPGQRSKHAKTGKFERVTDYRFDTGETMQVKQHGRGLEGSYLQMDVLFDGDVPKSRHHNSISLDDTEEEMVEEAPGLIRGHGHSALRLGKHTRIPFHWNHSINYDASKGMTIGAGKTLKMSIKSEHLIGDRGYKMAAKAKRKSKCPQGYEKVNGFCEDIDECVLDPTICGEEATCTNNDGGFTCERECPSGFKVKWDGTCMDVDECTLGTHNCTPGTQCTNTKGGFRCEAGCVDGYFMNENGECEDVDECASSPCEEPLVCHNQMGSYVCLCPSGFPLGDDERCQGVTTEGDIKPKVLRLDEEERNCPTGYTWNGRICEDVDECAFESPCQFECRNTPGGYQCECPEGYELDDGDCIDIDECADEPCTDDELCFNKLGSFDCIANPCPTGYHLDIAQCIANCANCSLAPIRIHMLSIPSDVKPGTSLLRLTAYDAQSRVLHRTRFHLKSSSKFSRRAPFALKNEAGRAVLQNVKGLLPNSNHRLTIRSISKSPFTNMKYHSDFIVFISVSDHPF